MAFLGRDGPMFYELLILFLAVVGFQLLRFLVLDGFSWYFLLLDGFLYLLTSLLFLLYRWVQLQ